MAKKAKQKKSAAKTANVDDQLAALAVILLETAAASMHINDLSSKLRVSAIAIYKWLNGSPISAAYAFLIVMRLKHRLDSIANKRQLEQAKKLMTECKSDLELCI